MAQLDVAKVVFGAFSCHGGIGAHSSALDDPLIALVTLTSLGTSLANICGAFDWLLLVLWGALALFAVTCHRLVFFDPQSVASRLRWSQRNAVFPFYVCCMVDLCNRSLGRDNIEF